MDLEKERQTKWNPNYSSWWQPFSSIWIFKGEVEKQHYPGEIRSL